MTLSYIELGYDAFPYDSVPYDTTGRSGSVGSQFEVLRAAIPVGAQFKALKSFPIGSQFNVKIYNTNNLRILCEFPSRGQSVVTGGSNSWGNPIGKGLNWTANSTAPSGTNSFDIKNVNTDLKEQVWRSDNVKSNLVLDCDTELAQGVFLDTFAMFSNLSRSATVRLIGSNVSNFLVIGFDQQLGGTGSNDDEIVYIAEDVPAKSFRYWRLEISDPTNTKDYLEVGTILFGDAIIFHQECFVDKVKLKKTNFVDSVLTAGFTTVQNDRGIKKSVKLEFRNLDYLKINYQNMLNVFDDARTVLKCLWIPTPEIPKRFMVFGKLTKIPEETHNVKSNDKDYINFTIEVDEAR